MEKPCRKCGVPFVMRWSTYLYCDACRNVTCIECGVVFVPKGLSVDPRYCSRACRSKHRFKGNRQDVPCAGCGTIVSRTASHRATKKPYCSYRCRATHNWKDPNVRAKMVAGILASPSLHTQQRKDQLAAASKLQPRDDAWREKIRAARMLQTFPIKMTSIEVAIHDALLFRGIPFTMHKTMFGRWQPDFVMNDKMLVVQADGDYWHSRPSAVINDARFNEAARVAGWVVVRLSESRIKCDIEGCMDEIERAYRAAPTVAPSGN